MARSLIWSDELAVGHPRVDADHHRLVDAAGEIEDMIDGGAAAEFIRQGYARLLALLAAHCAFEERLMRGLPRDVFGTHVDEHCRQHAALIHKLTDVADASQWKAPTAGRLAENRRVIFGLLKDLIFDDTLLIGVLVREDSLRRMAANPGDKTPAGGHQGRSVAFHLGTIAALVVLIGTLLVGYAIEVATGNAVADVRASARALVSTVAQDVRLVIQTNRDALDHMGQRPLIRTAGIDRCDPILADFRQVFPRFANIAVIDLDGIAVCSAVPQPGGKPVDVLHTEWFQRALAERRFIVGRPFIGPITGRWVSVLVSPVFDAQGRLVRFLGLPLDLVAYVPSVARAPLIPGTIVGILTADGTIVWRSLDPAGSVGQSVGGLAAFRAYADRGLTEYTAAGTDGIPRMYFVERIPESGWVAYVGVPTAAVEAVRRRVLLTGLTLASVSFLLVATIIVVLARRLTDPIRALAATARAIREGGTSVRAPLSGPREVVEVAREFNALIETRDRQTDELLRSNAELERFAQIAAHDLQEPIRTVVAYSQLLERRMAGSVDGDVREILGFIVNGARRMHELVRDLLAYSRLAGSETPFTALDMRSIVHDAVADLDAAIRDSGAKVEIDESSLPTVQGARVQLMELVRNLVANAIRFRRPGETPRIRIAMTAASGEKVFSVSDNGIGIERQYWGQIFVVFKRLHGSSYPGTGIGLATCKRIVECHHGRIWVESVPGQGSTFSFTLDG